MICELGLVVALGVLLCSPSCAAQLKRLRDSGTLRSFLNVNTTLLLLLFASCFVEAINWFKQLLIQAVMSSLTWGVLVAMPLKLVWQLPAFGEDCAARRKPVACAAVLTCTAALHYAVRAQHRGPALLYHGLSYVACMPLSAVFMGWSMVDQLKAFVINKAMAIFFESPCKDLKEGLLFKGAPLNVDEVADACSVKFGGASATPGTRSAPSWTVRLLAYLRALNVSYVLVRNLHAMVEFALELLRRDGAARAASSSQLKIDTLPAAMRSGSEHISRMLPAGVSVAVVSGSLQHHRWVKAACNALYCAYSLYNHRNLVALLLDAYKELADRAFGLHGVRLQQSASDVEACLNAVLVMNLVFTMAKDYNFAAFFAAAGVGAHPAIDLLTPACFISAFITTLAVRAQAQYARCALKRSGKRRSVCFA